MRNIVTAERNGEKWKKSTHLPRGFWWNKSFFWDFSLSSEQFYGNAKKRGVQKNVKYLIQSLLNLKKA